MKIYLVGGAVRDRLLGIPVKDHDWVVVGATVEAMRRQGYRQVGRDFPVFIDPASGEEYALARTERKSGRGHAGFTVFASPEVTLEEDLRRRDLTINAMAQEGDGALIDPYGGARDIQARLLRHVSPSFAEDPLRVLRVARFAARFDHLGFRVAGETLELMRTMSRDGELGELAPERVWQEIQRAMGEASPAAFVRVLRECGALEAVLPEVARLFGVPQPEKYHPEIDTGVHTLMALEQAARLTADPAARFATLAHDLGKAATPRERWPSHGGHEALGAALVDALCERLRAPNEFRELARLVSLHHTACHRAMGKDPGELLAVLEQADAFRRPDRFERFLLACEADARGRKGLESRPYPQAARLRRARAAAAGVDPRLAVAEGLRGPEIGARLKELRAEAIALAILHDERH